MNFNNILFLDIETVSQFETYNHLPEDWQELWDIKAQQLIRNKENETTESVYERAGIYAEFGKIICISCGVIQGSGEEKKLVVKSFCNDDEHKLLMEFHTMLQTWWTSADKCLCAHNGKEFDFPYICRRMVINGIPIPDALQMGGKKPWEIRHLLDTMEMWKFGDYKAYTSLKLLARAFGIPSPKDDIDGSMVNHVYWNGRDLDRIVHYCQKDVITLAQVLLRFHCKPLIRQEHISIKYVQQS